jgi:hypothetical protein
LRGKAAGPQGAVTEVDEFVVHASDVTGTRPREKTPIAAGSWQVIATGCISAWSSRAARNHHVQLMRRRRRLACYDRMPATTREGRQQ